MGKLTKILTAAAIGLGFTAVPAVHADSRYRVRASSGWNEMAIGRCATTPWSAPRRLYPSSRFGHGGRDGTRGARGLRDDGVQEVTHGVSVASARWDRALLGGLIGGTAGGVLGSSIGKGSGRVAAIIGGSVLGVLVGSSVGSAMDEIDRLHVQDSLENTPTHESAVWRNPDTEVEYAVTPLATYRDRGGRYCREYQTTATVGGRPQQVYGTACRQPDGSWQIVP